VLLVMSSSDEKDNFLSPVQESQKRKLENMSQNIAGGTSLKDLTPAISRLLDLPTKSVAEGLKQELKSDIGAISLLVKQKTNDNARLKEEVISLRSDREADNTSLQNKIDEIRLQGNLCFPVRYIFLIKKRALKIFSMVPFFFKV